MRPRLSLFLPVLAVLLGATSAGAADETERAIEALSSPAERVRLDAVDRLVARLPGSRDRVIAALADAGPEARLHLVEVLARDGSVEAVRALLGVLENADELLASRIQVLLARDAGATRAVLDTWEEDPASRVGPEGRPTPRMEELARVLRRAEAEGLFLSRKSTTGSTGSYRGQYAVLEPYREAALRLAVDILHDRAPALPGVLRVGKFFFLRDTKINWDIDDIQGMAAHCFAELATPEDGRALVELNALLKDIEREWRGTRYWFDEFKYRLLLARYTDLLTALYRVRPDLYEAKLAELIEDLRYGEASRATLQSALPILLLRVGRYREAVEEYRRILAYDGLPLSLAMTHYNLACAYAQWGLDFEGRERELRFGLALAHLDKAVRNQWSDVGWMDEDRDLDPIRDREAFAAIRARMIEAITPPEEREDGGGESESRPGSGR